MKHILFVLMIGVGLSLCNLTNKLKSSSNSNSNSTISTASNDGIVAELGTLTEAQTAALAGGQEIKWEQQGMSWTVPPKWTESSKESKEFIWRSPGGGDAANLIVSIS